MTNQRKEHNIEKYIQWATLQLCRYLHSFSCCCLPNLQNPTKFSENLDLYSSRSSTVINLGVNRKCICMQLPISH